MVNHLRGNKLKHNKNYITYHMNDPQGASLTKDMVMDLSVQLDNEGLDSMRLLNELVYSNGPTGLFIRSAYWLG